MLVGGEVLFVIGFVGAGGGARVTGVALLFGLAAHDVQLQPGAVVGLVAAVGAGEWVLGLGGALAESAWLRGYLLDRRL